MFDFEAETDQPPARGPRGNLARSAGKGLSMVFVVAVVALVLAAFFVIGFKLLLWLAVTLD
ncbi:hypothetical protein QLQ12_44465 [Actinoplanes sp. NEAU-A12]|uniref:Uncharacterized protein n=1 Tax=Actinoplanes sandaracinus TaxID=3045177 RepID=A0ABT6X0X5_9ACTN|nr:hypothetical protein [Actinoplanes sandaracinus]MDI6105658.1 hypothetical protein [Actinoplanes sandaracinus]